MHILKVVIKGNKGLLILYEFHVFLFMPVALVLTRYLCEESGSRFYMYSS